MSFSAEDLKKIFDEQEKINRITQENEETVSTISQQWRDVLSSVRNTSEGYRLGISSVEKLKDISDELRLNAKGIRDLSQKQLENYQRQTKTQFENFKLSKEILTQKKETTKLSESEKNLLDEINAVLEKNSVIYEDQLNYLEKRIEQEERIEKAQGLTGKTLKGLQGLLSKIGFEDMAEDFETASEEARAMAERVTILGTKQATFNDKIKVMGAGLKSIGKSLLEQVKDPLVLASVTIAGMVKLWNFFKDSIFEGNQNAIDLSREFGITKDNADNLRTYLSDAANKAENLLVTSSSAKEAFQDLNSSLGTFGKISDENLKTYITFNKNLNVSKETLQDQYKLSLLSGKSLKNQVLDERARVKTLAMIEGSAISERDIMEEVKNSSNAIKLNTTLQGKSLAEAAYRAKQLGMSLDQVSGIADSLLNFESSISAEMEAELITGKELNFEKARLYALNNDIEGVSREIAKQGINATKFTKMNAIAQESIAKSLGMSREELAKSLIEQEALQKVTSITSSLETKKQENIIKLYKEGKITKEQLEKLNKKELADLENQFSIREKFNDSLEKAKGAISDVFIEKFEPVLAKLAEMISSKQFAQTIEGFANGMKAGLDAITKIFGFVDKNLPGGLGGLIAVGGAVSLTKMIIGMVKGERGSPNNPTHVVVEGGGGLGNSGGGIDNPFEGVTEEKTKSGKTVYRDKKTGKFTAKPKVPGGASSVGGSSKWAKMAKIGGKLSKFSSLGGIAAGLGLDYLSEKASESGNKDAATALDVSSGALTGAGYGAMIGSIIPGAGNVVGGAVGGLAGGLYSYFNRPEDIPTQKDYVLKSLPEDTIVGAGGTKLGRTDEMVEILQELLKTIKQGGNVVLDGNKVGQTLSANTYRIQ